MVRYWEATPPMSERTPQKIGGSTLERGAIAPTTTKINKEIIHMRFSLIVDLGNAGMCSDRQLSNALRSLAEKLDSETPVEAGKPQDGQIRDVYGNTVGIWSVVNLAAEASPPIGKGRVGRMQAGAIARAEDEKSA